jgi:hypothetical protein
MLGSQGIADGARGLSTASQLTPANYLHTSTSPGGAFGDLDRRDVQDQDADLTATSTWVLLIRTPALPGRHPLRQ